MVLESIANPISAEQHPVAILLLGILYGTAGLFFSLWIFKEYASLVLVFLTVYAALPIMYKTMRFEEKKDLVLRGERTILLEHKKALYFFIMLFIGLVIAYTTWSLILPSALANQAFSVQQQTITALNKQVTGSIVNFSVFSNIFVNNVKVMLFALFFSFMYGSGAIFILSWNASVIGAAAAKFIEQHTIGIAGTGIGMIGGYTYAIGLTIIRYAIHGIPEILSYFIAGLAGGILSFALMRKDYRHPNFENILLDVSDLLFIAVGVLLVAGILEVFVTPGMVQLLS